MNINRLAWPAPISAPHARDLRGVVERESAEIGVFISFKEPTKAMRTEAASAGFYDTPWGRHPKIQLLTVAELLEGKSVNYPPSTQVNVTFKKAPKAKGKKHENMNLAFPDNS